MTDPLEARVEALEARVHALERRPRGKPVKGLEWALRPSVAQRLLPELEERQAQARRGRRPPPAAPMVEDAARDAGGWDALIIRLRQVLNQPPAGA